jgi:PIN domain nuclease of toxin-antitoxin system
VKLLLDTHLLLWAAGQPERLPKRARSLLLDAKNQLLFSSASLWEVAIKRDLGRKDFTVDPSRLWQRLLANGYLELPVSGEHAITTSTLPRHHKDPFDRILIAQARVEGLTLLTGDASVGEYGKPVMLV